MVQLSGPVAFVTPSDLSTDFTSLTVRVNSDISGEAGALAALPDEGGGGGGGLRSMRLTALRKFFNFSFRWLESFCVI